MTSSVKLNPIVLSHFYPKKEQNPNEGNSAAGKSHGAFLLYKTELNYLGVFPSILNTPQIKRHILQTHNVQLQISASGYL